MRFENENYFIRIFSHKEGTMIKKLIVFLTFVALGLVLAGVAQAETVRGEGRYVEQQRTDLTPFHAIDVRGDAHVDIWQQGKQSVRVSGKQNLVALANLRVEDQTLIIDFKRPIHIKGAHALQVTVTVPELTALSVHSNGKARIRGMFEAKNLSVAANDEAEIDGDSIKADILRLQVMNKADIDLERVQVKNLEAASFDRGSIELSGHAQTAQLTNNGHDDIDAADLRINHAQVAVNDKGDVEVFVMHSLNAHANGSGKIVYHGQPTLTRGGNVKKIQPAFDD